MHALLLAQANDATPLLFGGGLMLFFIVLGVLGLGLWLWALIDAIQNPALTGNTRLIWILVILLTNWIGALLYLTIGRSRQIA